jgi:hypothetical protein
MPLPTRQTEDDVFLHNFGGRGLPTTLAKSVGAITQDPRLRPTQLLSEYQQEDPERFRRQTAPLAVSPIVGAYTKAIEAFGYAFPSRQPEPDDDVMLTPEQVKAEFGHLGVTFNRPTPRRVAEMTSKRRQEDMHREEIIAASPQNLAAKGVRFGSALMGAVVDPLNIASAFIPVMGEARFASITATAGRATARVASGAEAGFVGSLAIEPLTYGLSKQLQLDYSMGDALLNIALGTTIGAGLHVGVGAVADRAAYIKSGKGTKALPVLDIPLPETALRASPEAVEGAMRGAVAQFVEGKPVDVAPIFEVDRGFADASATKNPPKLVVARRMPDGAIKQGRPGQVHTDLMSREELAADVDSPEIANSMGYATPDGKFLNRIEALEFARAFEPERAAFSDERPEFGLDAATYNEATAINRVPLAPAERAQAIAPHKAAINRLVESKTDFEESIQAPGVEPVTEFNVAQAEQFDTEALELIEQAMVDARNLEPKESDALPKGETEQPPMPKVEGDPKGQKELDTANENVTVAEEWGEAVNQLALCISRKG